MKPAKVLLIVSFSICILLGLTQRAMSRNAIPGKQSGTSENPSTVNLTSRDKALDGLIILYGTTENANTSIPPPPMQKLFQGGNYLTIEQSQFIVTYEGFTDEAREAFQYAVDIWKSLLRSPVPIRIDASFTDFGGFEDGVIILGGARPAGWKSPGSLDLWFPEPLADKRAGRDLTDDEPDIITRFNSHEDANWYFGTDGNTPAGKTDFVSTVLHEIAHGLGFFSFARVEEGSIRTFSASVGRGKLRGSTPKLPYIYDFFVENGAGTTILSFRDPSFALENQITSNDLFWNGKKATEANGGILPHLYAPSSWEQGSSYTHLDEITFPAGTPNSLMTPYYDNQEAVHDPGPIALGMLEDMGWIINKAPVFTDGSSTTRPVAVDGSIGSPVAATDVNNDTLIYQLSGTDAAAFEIDSTTGQLKTKASHNYNTKAVYTVTITVSDGTLIDEITVTINVISTETETPTNSSPSFVDGNHTSRTVAENTETGVNIGNPITATDADNDSLTYTLGGPDATSFDIDNTTGQLKTDADLDYETKKTYTVTVTVSDGNLTITITVIIIIIDLEDEKSPTLTLTSQPLTETTLNGSIATLTLSNRIYENWLSDPVTVSGIPGVTIRPFDVTRLSDTELSVQLTFYGTDLDADATLTFTVKADAIASYDGPDLTATAHVTAAVESIVASTEAPLTEAALNRSVVTLTLQGGVYESQYTVGNSVTVSGILGVTVNRFNVERLNDTQVNVELIFDGTDFDTDATLTFTVGADAVTGYNGTPLIAQLPVSAVVEQSPIITAYTPQLLTEATLNESIVTLTLSSGMYTQSSSDISSTVQVSGIAGVTFLQSDVVRVSSTKVTVKLIFDDTDFDTDATLTFTVGPDAISNYDGSALIAAIPVAAVIEENPTITAFATQPLTETTLNGSIIRLTLNNGTYVRSNFDIDSAVTVSGIAGVTVGFFGVERVSDTVITFELEFNGNLDTNATLTFTVGADAIVEYDGPARIARITVNGGQESIIASTEAPLTETTLNGSVVKLTLNGAIYERSTFDLRDAVEVSGIEGVTFHWFDLDRVSDTELTIELTFRGNIDTDAILTFTVGADAIADYNGPPLSAQVTVTGSKESVTASSETPLTETTLNDSVVTLTLSGRYYARSSFDIERAVTIDGLQGVTIYDVDRINNTEITVELRFNGDFDTDTTLTFTVGANALLRYNGPALTTQLPVTGGHESIATSTKAPLTEATLDRSVITLTLTGRNYVRSSFDIERAMTMSGIEGVTIYDVDRINNTKITVELTFEGDFDADAILTLTIGPNAIANYNGPAFTAQVSVSGGQESITASTKAPLTEATLDRSVITLTLTGRNYVRSSFDIERAMTMSGIEGVTIYDVDRNSNTEATVELAFNGDFDADTTLTFTIGPNAIASYNGPAFIAQVSVSGGQESIVASTKAPLTEATLDESVVTLTLKGRKYARSTFDIRRAVSVSGINGVTIPWHEPDKKSDTEITVELEFDGNINADSTLTFTVGPGAIANYNGPALAAQITVTADRENALLANFPNPFNPETWIPYQLSKSTQVTITIYAVNGQIVRELALGHQPAGTYQNRSRAAYWDGRNELGEPVASGVYFYTITAGDFTATRKMLIQK